MPSHERVIALFSRYEEEWGDVSTMAFSVDLVLCTDILVRFLFSRDAGSNRFRRMGAFLQDVGHVFGFMEKTKTELRFKSVSLWWPSRNQNDACSLNDRTDISVSSASPCSPPPSSVPCSVSSATPLSTSSSSSSTDRTYCRLNHQSSALTPARQHHSVTSISSPPLSNSNTNVPSQQLSVLDSFNAEKRAVKEPANNTGDNNGYEEFEEHASDNGSDSDGGIDKGSGCDEEEAKQRKHKSKQQKSRSLKNRATV